MPNEIVNGRPEREDYIQDTRDPDELLRERSSRQKITPRNDQGYQEDKDKEDDGVGIEGELVTGMVDATA